MDKGQKWINVLHLEKLRLMTRWLIQLTRANYDNLPRRIKEAMIIDVASPAPSSFKVHTRKSRRGMSCIKIIESGGTKL